MQGDLYKLDGDRIQRLLDDQKWKQLKLKIRSRLSQRTIAYVMSGGPVSCETALKVAAALDVPLVELGPRLAHSPRWSSIPQLSPKVYKKQKSAMEEAVAADMKGHYRKAIQVAEAVLVSLDRSKDMEVYDAVFVRLLTFMDHAAERGASVKYEQIDQRIRDFERDYAQSESTSSPWIRYQRGICLRKLRKWIDARTTIKILLVSKDKDLHMAAAHQLAVVDLDEAKTSKPQTKRTKLLSEARKRLKKCAVHWKKVGIHRAGFSLRRLGELEQLSGDRKKALRHYLAALQIFAHHSCDRYAANTCRNIETLI